MGVYEVYISPDDGRLSRTRAVGRAREMAFSERISVRGKPKVRVKRSAPVIGRRLGYRVTFPQAHRVERLPTT